MIYLLIVYLLLRLFFLKYQKQEIVMFHFTCILIFCNKMFLYFYNWIDTIEFVTQKIFVPWCEYRVLDGYEQYCMFFYLLWKLDSKYQGTGVIPHTEDCMHTHNTMWQMANTLRLGDDFLTSKEYSRFKRISGICNKMINR